MKKSILWIISFVFIVCLATVVIHIYILNSEKRDGIEAHELLALEKHLNNERLAINLEKEKLKTLNTQEIEFFNRNESLNKRIENYNARLREFQRRKTIADKDNLYWLELKQLQEQQEQEAFERLLWLSRR